YNYPYSPKSNSYTSTDSSSKTETLPVRQRPYCCSPARTVNCAEKGCLHHYPYYHSWHATSAYLHRFHFLGKISHSKSPKPPQQREKRPNGFQVRKYKTHRNGRPIQPGK